MGRAGVPVTNVTAILRGSGQQKEAAFSTSQLLVFFDKIIKDRAEKSSGFASSSRNRARQGAPDQIPPVRLHEQFLLKVVRLCADNHSSTVCSYIRHPCIVGDGHFTAHNMNNS